MLFTSQLRITHIKTFKTFQKSYLTQLYEKMTKMNIVTKCQNFSDTHKFNNTNDITACNLKVRLITAQSEKNMYNAAQVTVTTY